MQWKPFEFAGVAYDLRHLHPKTWSYMQPAKDGKPEHTYHVEIRFSLHCFTRGLQPGEAYEPGLCYSDDRETRLFDFRRYALSKRLPAIFETLQQRKCYHTGKSNFLTVEDVAPVEYEIFFTVSRASRRSALNVFVQSAYARDTQQGRLLPRKPIGLHLILFNVLHNRPIKRPQ